MLHTVVASEALVLYALCTSFTHATHIPLSRMLNGVAQPLLQMLLDFPKTDINLKSDGGTTPLMDAVKSTNMLYMVKQLVKKNADISLTDYEGTVHIVCIVRA